MGHEKTFTALTAALAGTSFVYGAGMTESGVTFDPAQLVMDDEWIAMIRHFLAGIRVDAETIAGADIAAVGPFGDFLSLPSTYARMREQSLPRLMDRRVREEWVGDGATSMYERARLRACELLDGHRREPLDEDVKRQMRRIVERADAEHGPRSLPRRHGAGETVTGS
jgi:trimethylamine--corrinoid protein Co-methyltransferase